MENNEKEKVVRNLFGNMHKLRQAPVLKIEQKPEIGIETNPVSKLF